MLRPCASRYRAELATLTLATYSNAPLYMASDKQAVANKAAYIRNHAERAHANRDQFPHLPTPFSLRRPLGKP